METPLNGVIIGVTLSVAVGLFFGIYPARRASRLDPDRGLAVGKLTSNLMNLLLSVIGLALATLRENKVRSFLTLLGVMIGTGTIIGVGSILTGLDGAVTGAIRSLGTNTAIVMKIGPSFGGGRTPEQRMRRPLTYENVAGDRGTLPVGGAREPHSAAAQRQSSRARYKGNDAFQLQMFGTAEYYATAGQADMKTGRFFTDAEDRHRMSVAVHRPGYLQAAFRQGGRDREDHSGGAATSWK